NDLLRWPRLLKWISDDRAFLLWRQNLNKNIAKWSERNHEKSALLSGKRLDQAKTWKADRLNDLNMTELAYINLSIDENERLLLENTERKKEEILQTRPPRKNLRFIANETENRQQARKIIAGQEEDFDIMFDLAKRLKNDRAFGYARRILE